jgi:hexosaminidase
MWRFTILLIFLFKVQFSWSQSIIPLPDIIAFKEGFFDCNENVMIRHDRQNEFSAQYFSDYIQEFYGIKIGLDDKDLSPGAGRIIFKVNPSHSNEYYKLKVSSAEILIEGGAAGCFYAVQSLIQLLELKNGKCVIPAVEIEDKPRFGWRGLHLDVCRHFFSIDFVKKYIDLMARHKLNTFHWHLTDDQGWRIEIKKYPKLTEVGGWRKETIVDKNFEPFKGDGQPYGGFYTQEQIREVVEYARKRHVTVVPEIEMPGHALAALAAYPEYSCSGGPFEVGTKWGVFEDVFCPTEKTFKFLEDILTEVIGLFPSEYIHIGGDECPKESWRKSAFCQALMKEKGLKDEHELQSYFVRRIEIILAARGRKLIGWDEILEGGLAPGAAVMSWRGEDGGIQAAKAGHRVVMTPGSHCYFDHYQSKSTGEPLAIGGFTPLEKVYQYEPVPKALTTSESKFVMGAQANLWTEYIKTPQHAEYMAYPRACALAEVLWTMPEKKSPGDFYTRLTRHFSLLASWSVNYSRAFYEIKTEIKTALGNAPLYLELKQRSSDGQIFYTTDGADPRENGVKYAGPVAIDKSMQIKYIDRNAKNSIIQSQQFELSKASGKPITLIHPPDERYGEGGALGLVNGILADENLSGGRWLGWWGTDLDATIDLGSSQSIAQVELGLLRMENSWIYLPQYIEISTSGDGQKFETIAKKNSQDYSSGGRVKIDFKPSNARYVKVFAKNFGTIPNGKEGEGNKSWLFVDEILVR